MDLTSISKKLSKALRHSPEQFGLVLDKSGWTSVQRLIDSFGITADTLREVVETNNKQRFEFSEDGIMIRARQGHSVEVDLQLTATRPPAHLYHGTVQNALPSIMKDGLLKMNRHHVHLSESVETATIVASRRKSGTVILTVNSAAMFADGHKFYKTENNVWLTDAVDPKYIKK